MPKPLQVLSGIFPLPQTREPYSIVGYLAERVPVERIYALKPIGLGQAAVISKSLNAASAAASGSTKPKVSKVRSLFVHYSGATHRRLGHMRPCGS